MDKDASPQLLLLNCHPEFNQVYCLLQPGAPRRKALMALFRTKAKLPVNNKWQANIKDPDLRKLLKSGFLVRIRPGGRGRPGSRVKKSFKQQTYLMWSGLPEPNA